MHVRYRTGFENNILKAAEDRNEPKIKFVAVMFVLSLKKEEGHDARNFEKEIRRWI